MVVINPIPKLTVVLQDGRVDAWQSIDDLIVQRRIISAMQAIREAEGCSLQRAIDVFADRYELLRRTRPDDFKVSRDEYWRGVYT
ncbi:hypothetical protein GA0074695_4010 [Micromonospora viridifaciens]|uniref:Uncharacterized protein n=2 Tax=Micromonospora viridifaciens TaxID=1881 RepID=A0A1C4YA70_MICVI|nr:hypothetical protein GA0074695_4010 [Micromonospora viridifaciens]